MQYGHTYQHVELEHVEALQAQQLLHGQVVHAVPPLNRVDLSILLVWNSYCDVEHTNRGVAHHPTPVANVGGEVPHAHAISPRLRSSLELGHGGWRKGWG